MLKVMRSITLIFNVQKGIADGSYYGFLTCTGDGAEQFQANFLCNSFTLEYVDIVVCPTIGDNFTMKGGPNDSFLNTLPEERMRWIGIQIIDKMDDVVNQGGLIGKIITVKEEGDVVEQYASNEGKRSVSEELYEQIFFEIMQPA